MMVQDESNARNVTLILARLSSIESKTGSTMNIPSLNSYGFVVQPALESLRLPEPLQNVARPGEGWREASFLIEMHLGVTTKHFLSQHWCISLPSPVKSFAGVLLRSLRETIVFLQGLLRPKCSRWLYILSTKWSTTALTPTKSLMSSSSMV